MSFSDLTKVSNFSWRCQLLYELLFVELRWKLKNPEITISHRVILENRKKSQHRLALTFMSLNKSRTNETFQILITKLYFCIFVDKDVKLIWMRRVESILRFSWMMLVIQSTPLTIENCHLVKEQKLHYFAMEQVIHFCFSMKKILDFTFKVHG